MRASGRDPRAASAFSAALLALLLAAVALGGAVSDGSAAALHLGVAALALAALWRGTLAPLAPAALGLAAAWSAVSLASTLWGVEPDAALDASAGTLAASLCPPAR